MSIRAAAAEEGITSDFVPQQMVFKDVQGGRKDDGDPPTFSATIRSLVSIAAAPPGRPDLEAIVAWMMRATAEDVQDIIDDVVARVRASGYQRRVAEHFAQQAPLAPLSHDEVCAIAAYTLEQPIALYKILNAWLQSTRRDEKVVTAVGPFFVLLYRALEKLPRRVVQANRGVQCREIKSLLDTYDNYKERCKPGSDLAFWGLASFSTRDDVAGDPFFVGQPGEPGIVYSVGRLECVDVAPFSLMAGGCDDGEAEVLPLPPLLLKVHSTFMTPQRKLIISCDVVPRGTRSGGFVVARFDDEVVSDAALAQFQKENPPPQHYGSPSQLQQRTAGTTSDIRQVTVDDVNDCVTEEQFCALLRRCGVSAKVVAVLGEQIAVTGVDFLQPSFMEDAFGSEKDMAEYGLKQLHLRSLQELHARLLLGGGGGGGAASAAAAAEAVGEQPSSAEGLMRANSSSNNNNVEQDKKQSFSSSSPPADIVYPSAAPAFPGAVVMSAAEVRNEFAIHNIELFRDALSNSFVATCRRNRRIRALRVFAVPTKQQQQQQQQQLPAAFVQCLRAQLDWKASGRGGDKYLARVHSVSVTPDGGAVHVVSDLVRGRSLRGLMMESAQHLHHDGHRRGLLSPLDEEAVKRYIKRLFSALAALHRAKLSHGGICLDTIVVDPKSNVAVFEDAGLTSKLDAAAGQLSNLLFLAPEQIRSSSAASSSRGLLSQKSDVWQMGVLAFFLLTGAAPFSPAAAAAAAAPDSSPEQQKAALLQDIAAKLHAGPLDWPEGSMVTQELRDFVTRRLLVADPMRRGAAEQLVSDPSLQSSGGGGGAGGGGMDSMLMMSMNSSPLLGGAGGSHSFGGSFTGGFGVGGMPQVLALEELPEKEVAVLTLNLLSEQRYEAARAVAKRAAAIASSSISGPMSPAAAAAGSDDDDDDEDGDHVMSQQDRSGKLCNFLAESASALAAVGFVCLLEDDVQDPTVREALSTVGFESICLGAGDSATTVNPAEAEQQQTTLLIAYRAVRFQPVGAPKMVVLPQQKQQQQQSSSAATSLRGFIIQSFVDLLNAGRIVTVVAAHLPTEGHVGAKKQQLLHLHTAIREHLHHQDQQQKDDQLPSSPNNTSSSSGSNNSNNGVIVCGQFGIDRRSAQEGHFLDTVLGDFPETVTERLEATESSGKKMTCILASTAPAGLVPAPVHVASSSGIDDHQHHHDASDLSSIAAAAKRRAEHEQKNRAPFLVFPDDRRRLLVAGAPVMEDSWPSDSCAVVGSFEWS